MHMQTSLAQLSVDGRKLYGFSLFCRLRAVHSKKNAAAAAEVVMLMACSRVAFVGKCSG